MRIIANCLVKNEENFIWFAINSVVDEVDSLLVWDTGSTDRTVEIIKSIKSPKIKFEQKGNVDAKGIVGLRQQMLEKSDCDWIFILDGDEIWWKGVLSNTIKRANGYDIVVNPTRMLVGDIFHYQPDSAGKYKIKDRKGHLNIRLIRRGIKGLRLQGEYPLESYVDISGTPVQNFPEERIFFSDEYYLHASHLKRSSVESRKFKYEIGNSFPLDFYYPEVLFERDRPSFIKSPWQLLKRKEMAKAFLLTLPRRIKRKII